MNTPEILNGKHIVLGITGSIAAYKACLLIRLLTKKGANVQVVITPSGKEFITPLTLSTLTGNPVVSDFFDRRDGSWHSHVSLGLWADAMLIAPATASTIAKMANGIADNILLTTYLSMRAPVFVAPAMDLDMFVHTTTKRNLEMLSEAGNCIISPTEGLLASGLEGKGRMEEPEEIVLTLERYFSHDKRFTGKKILITAGPTFERIDPVRFIGNYSSGKMGIALADTCARHGAEVILICGPTTYQTKERKAQRIDIESAADMYAITTKLFPTTDAAILCAAVADFTPINPETRKIKRKQQEFTLALKPTLDIAQTLGGMKTKNQVIAGFALETNNEIINARQKLESKNLDFIVLNSLADTGAGFRTDTNKITILTSDREISFPLKNKSAVAEDIVNFLGDLL